MSYANVIFSRFDFVLLQIGMSVGTEVFDFSGEHNEHHSYFLRFKTGIGAQLFAYGRTTVWV